MLDFLGIFFMPFNSLSKILSSKSVSEFIYYKIHFRLILCRQIKNSPNANAINIPKDSNGERMFVPAIAPFRISVP